MKVYQFIPKINPREGAAMVTALMLLVLLTILGLASTNTTIYEQKITQNETAYRRGFYISDGGVQYALSFTKNELPDVGEYFDVPASVPFEIKYEREVRDLPKRVEILAKVKDDVAGDGVSPIKIQAEVQFTDKAYGQIAEDDYEEAY